MGGQSIPAFDFYLAPYVRATFEEECEKLGLNPDYKVTDYYSKEENGYYTRAKEYTVRRVHQAMEAFVHNMNTMRSRGGGQTVFSSVNFGTDTSPEGRCVIREYLQAVWEGVGNGQTAIFPISIFKVKSGVNYNPGDPNYDLFKMATIVTAKRFFPNYINLDAPFNRHEKWDANDPKRYMYEPATMGYGSMPSHAVMCG